jgi:hypothetical protein
MRYVCILCMIIAAGCVLVLFVIRQLQGISSGRGLEIMCDRWSEHNQPRHCVSKSFCAEM